MPIRWTVVSALLALPQFAAAQSVDPDTRINVYRFVLDVDVPESPGLVALGLATARALRSAAPKPVAAHIAYSQQSDSKVSALSIDVAPYYLAGGGARTLRSFTANSVAGRLMRVLTKTLASVAVAHDDRTGAALRVGFGIRSTIHDPHDPVLNWGLADSVILRLRRAGVTTLPDADEDIAGHGVDFRDLFFNARRNTRKRCCNQIALGWAADMNVRGGFAARDSTSDLEHQLWAAFQLTLGARYDILITPRVLDLFGDPDAGLGVGLQRKGASADFRTELFYRSDGELLPGVATEIHLVPSVGAVAAITTDARPGANPIVFRTQLRWYQAHRN